MYDSFSAHGRGGSALPRQARSHSYDDVIALVARQKALPIRMLVHPRRSSKPVARARQLAMYLSHVMLGRNLQEVGDAFGRDRTTISYACALIEDMRDDPRFDEEVSALESQIEKLISGEGDHG